MALEDNTRVYKLGSSSSSIEEKHKESAMERAGKLQSALRKEHPSFSKLMLRSHVTQGFWLGLPTKFCKDHLPAVESVEMQLVDDLGDEYPAKYLGLKNGLSGGWQRFAKLHKIQEGDVAVFELFHKTKFKIYVCKGDTKHMTNNQPLDDIEKKVGDISMCNAKKKAKKKGKELAKGKGRQPSLAADSYEAEDEEEGAASTLEVGMYAIQCAICCKWRVMPTLGDFEDIRKNMVTRPFYCHDKANVSCRDPEDIPYDSNNTWIIDKPNLPKAPQGFTRNVVVKDDYSSCVVSYITPTGEKLRSRSELLRFLRTSPEYKTVMKFSDFDFTSPIIMEETLPPKEGAATVSSYKGYAGRTLDSTQYSQPEQNNIFCNLRIVFKTR